MDHVASSNLGEAYPSVILKGVAAIVDPRLAPPEPVPIADAEPAVPK